MTPTKKQAVMYEDGILELQMQLTSMAVDETNKQRAIVRRLQKELAEQIPTIWAQQEMIEMLRQRLKEPTP